MPGHEMWMSGLQKAGRQRCDVHSGSQEKMKDIFTIQKAFMRTN
jgi:hypothetical protein